MNKINLDGRVALVTGATGGWGRGAAIALANHGATVALSARTQENLDLLKSEILDAGGKAIGIRGDMGTFAAASTVVESTVESLGRIDILVNSVGAVRSDMNSWAGEDSPWNELDALGGSLLNLTPQDWENVIAVELTSVFACTKVAAKHMIEQGDGGRIVTVAGGAGIWGLANAGAHAAAKGGTASAMWSWSDELKDAGITFNMVRGRVRSYLTDSKYAVSEEQRDSDPGSRALGTYDAAEAAPLIVWLASNEARDFTGLYLGIDGSRIVIWEPKEPDTAVYSFPNWTAEDIGKALLPILRRRQPRPDPRNFYNTLST